MISLTIVCLALVQTPSLLAQESDLEPLVAWGDWNGDGRPDALVLEPGMQPRLVVHRGEGRFEDVGPGAGLPTRTGFDLALWSDFDADGREDLLLVARAGGSLLLRNAPDGVFEDVGATSGLPLAQPVRSARWIDVDPDGLEDLELATESGHELFHNRGSGSFARLDWLGRGPVSPVGTARVSVPTRATETAELAPDSVATRTPVTGRPGSSRSGAPVPRQRSDRSATPPAILKLISDLAACAVSIKDQAASTCLRASSLPTLGFLYPLSTALNVDLADHVGMGTTANTHKLTVQGTSGNDVLRLMGTLGSTNYGARLDFGDPGRAYIEEDPNNRLRAFGETRVTLETDPNIGQIHVNTHSTFFNGVRVVLPPMVGIGLSLPSWPIDVAAAQAVAKFDSTNSSNGSVIELRNSTPGTPGLLGALNFADNAGQFPGQIAYSGGDELTFRTNGAQSMLIDANGDVGLGTTTPSARLHAKVSSGAGVRGESSDLFGDGVYGIATNGGTGQAWGVRGESHAVGGQGVHGEATATTGLSHGVLGSAASPDAAGVFGVNGSLPTSGLNPASGVYGEVQTEHGQGGWFKNWSNKTGYPPAGLVATGWGSSAAYAIWAEGHITATGTKFFVQPIPGDPAHLARFICLEGNEAGTYCRGSETLVNGRALIPMPEEFSAVTSDGELTAQLTPRGPAVLWVESCTRDELIVRGDADVAFDWVVNGLRRGFEDTATIIPNDRLVPRVRGVPYVPGATPAYRQVLVDAGITNADGTPNEATAARLGWKLLESDDPRAQAFLPPAMRTTEVDAKPAAAVPTGTTPTTSPVAAPEPAAQDR